MSPQAVLKLRRGFVGAGVGAEAVEVEADGRVRRRFVRDGGQIAARAAALEENGEY